MPEITTPQLADRLGVGARQARALVGGGAFVARQLPSREWLIDSDSVARYTLHRQGAGRRLSGDTAWALLYELSGVNAATLLAPATYARVRRRIRTMTPEDLAAAVGGRTGRHRFRSANASKAQADLIPTARVASGLIASDLLPDTRRVAGYVPVGTTAEEYARTHFMVADPAGPDVLYDNTAPGDGYTAPLAAVVAADLAVSTDSRERSAGIHALKELADSWLREHTR